MLNSKVTFSPAFERNNVPVGIASSNLFAPYAGVFIQSLLDHASEEYNYDIIIFESEISKENKRLLRSFATGHANISIRFYDLNPYFASSNLNSGNDVRFFPIDVLCRIIAPHILNYSGRFITVDIDTLLKTDIARLINEDLEGFSVGGVCDVPINGMYLCDHISFSKDIKVRDYFQNVCGLDDLKSYVNAGLLLFDCDKYIQELDIETILNTARQGKYIWLDQDILNFLMKGRIKLLDFAWNVEVQSNPRNVQLFDAGSKLFGGACEQAYENPYLLHWAGRPKPWVCPDVPWGAEWWQTALRTPFVGHIISRMMCEQEKRRQYYKKRYGKEDVDVWDPTPKGIDRT